jgi:hypothetical protein
MKVANGQVLLSEEQVLGLTWWSQGSTFSTDMRILDICAYDAILGVDWLKHCGKMTCDWDKKYISFWHQGAEITLNGIVTPPTTELSELSIDQLHKWLAGNDVWAMAILDTATSPSDGVLKQFPLIFRQFYRSLLMRSRNLESYLLSVLSTMPLHWKLRLVL